MAQTVLLWGTGDPLAKVVRDVFREAGLAADLTTPGATYDITVTLPEGRRLLIEVTGIDGQINKGSKKIGQVFDTAQSVAQDGDRVVIAVNAYRDKPVGDRKGLKILTPEAGRLLAKLDAVVVTTSALFDVWKLTLDEPPRALEELVRIHGAPAGLMQIPAQS